MNDTTDYTPSRTIRTLNSILRLARLLLLIGTIWAIGLLVVALGSDGDVTTTAILDAPFTAELSDGRYVGVDESGSIRTYGNFDIGDEDDFFSGEAQLHATFNIADEDVDSRIVVALSVTIWIAAAWVGLIALQGVFESAVQGEPFSRDNPRRLRRLAGAIFAVVIASELAKMILDRTIESELPFRITAGTGLGFPIALGLLVLVLSQLFSEAARLREFERETI